MNYLLGNDWKEFFDVTICHAMKPTWFVVYIYFSNREREQENRPFRLLNQSTGVWNWDTNHVIQKGDVVVQGSWNERMDLWKW